MAKEQILETSLYKPVKSFLEGLGFEAKGEIGGCDIVAVSQGLPAALIICELKMSFNLELVLQAVDRSAACDEVWLAVPASLRGRGRESDPRVKKLCRLCGFGLLTVLNTGRVEVLVEPVAWKPRHDGKRKSRLADEHRKRRGDPTAGGSTRLPIMTAYRQQALACAAALKNAPQRPRDLKLAAPDAPKILLHNVYGWFERVERGIYSLTDAGRKALVQWQVELPVAPDGASLAPARKRRSEKV